MNIQDIMISFSPILLGGALEPKYSRKVLADAKDLYNIFKYDNPSGSDLYLAPLALAETMFPNHKWNRELVEWFCTLRSNPQYISLLKAGALP